MPLRKEVGLGPGHTVLDGDPVGTQRPHSSPSPLFGQCLFLPNGRPSQQLLSSCSILAALLHGTRAVGVGQILRRGRRKVITELSQTAPPIFGRAAITFGIGPHSSVTSGALA